MSKDVFGLNRIFSQNKAKSVADLMKHEGEKNGVRPVSLSSENTSTGICVFAYFCTKLMLACVLGQEDS